jgi:uncharacterized membrane protein
MAFEQTVTIDSPTEQVWSVYADVVRWPEWTESVASVELLDGAPLALDARARIRQPRLPVAVWKVTALDAGSHWTWVASSPGIRTTATHTLTPQTDGTTRVDTSLRQEGPLGWVIARVYAGLTRRSLAMEAEGLKRRCESNT